jgi:hypothetical protein
MKKFIVSLAVIILSANVASALIIPTSGSADGMIGRDWWSNPNYYWVAGDAATIDAYHDGGSRWWYRGLVIIDISSLAGKTIESATFNFLSYGFSGVQLQYNDGVGPALNTGYGQIGGSYISTLDGTTGWRSYDVASLIQSSVNNGKHYAGFVFYANVNYGGGQLASSESGNAAFLNVIPEPATIAILGIGGLLLRRKK